MKITKIRTRMGELQTPVSTELDLVVERMRSFIATTNDLHCLQVTAVVAICAWR